MPEIIHHPSSIIHHRRGVALLTVLFIVMAVTVVSLGILARSSTELASGRNMALRLTMDQLAASGLEHARGLALNPQGVAPAEVDPTDGYWIGATDLQLDETSNDFYNVSMSLDDSDPNVRCNYTIESTAYRLKDSENDLEERMGESRLSATLRLDPAIALWTGAATTLTSGLTIHGDVCCGGTLTNYGTINGDVFAADFAPADGSVSGQLNPQPLSLEWPVLIASDPQGDQIIAEPDSIEGMLLVDGDLIIHSSGVRLTAPKDLPAVYVTGNLVLHGAADLQIEGLVVVDGHVLVGHGCADVRIVGGLFVGGEIAETTLDASGYYNDAMLRNIPTWSGDGVLALDGGHQYVRTPDDDTSLQLIGEYTLSVQLKPAADQKPWAGIVTKADPTGSTNHWVLQFDDSSERRLVVCHDTHKWDAGLELADVAGGWHHVAVVRQADGTMLSYLDGEPRKTLDPNTKELDFKNSTPGSGLSHLNIGADRTGTSNYVYKGLLADVRIYDQALSDDQVLSLATDPFADLPFPIAHWTFDGSGADVTVTADPARAAIVDGDGKNWSPAAGAFFKTIHRKP